MTNDEILAAQAGHARYRVVELRALNTARCARDDADRAAATLKALGGEPIDGDLPEDLHDAALELERRAYELTNPPRRVAA